MIYIKAGIPKELGDIEGELKAFYHSINTVFFIFKNKEQRNEFVEITTGMKKVERETIYQEYLS